MSDNIDILDVNLYIDNKINDVKAYVEGGGDINKYDRYGNHRGNFPLHFACDYQSYEIAEYLISKGADINMKGYVGLTPLHYATQRGNYDIVKLLITKGAEVNTKSFGGATPLLLAAMFGKDKIVELLIANGADIKMDAGKTARDEAEKRGFQNIVQLIDNALQ